MSRAKIKGAALYAKLRAQRERLVKKYEAGGTIRYDEAIGMRDVGGPPHQNQFFREWRSHPDPLQFDGQDVFPELARTTVFQPNLEDIKARNEAEFGPGTTMLEALKKRASGKVLQLFGDDDALFFGGFLLGDTECLIRVMEDLTGEIFVGSFPAYNSPFAPTPAKFDGLIHALQSDDLAADNQDTPHVRAVEKETLGTRGSFKQENYRLSPRLLKDESTIWGYQDASRQPIMLLGHNSMIRMWGENQVLDLNGKRLSMHERPNRIAGFSVLVDLSDGHFASLTQHSAKNCHIYSSQQGGMFARNNHFAVRGHFVENLLIEDVQSGDAETLNHGSYFGTCILNKSSNVVVKNLQQQSTNRAVSHSGLGLSWYAQLAFTELLFGYYEPVEKWDQVAVPANPQQGIPADIKTSDLFPWMKWEDIEEGEDDKYAQVVDGDGNVVVPHGKKTAYPVIKTVAELEALGLSTDEATLLRSELEAADAAYVKGTKAADDAEVATNVGHNAINVLRTNPNAPDAGVPRIGFPMGPNQTMTDPRQIPRSTNAIVHNPLNDDRQRYPDSISYGFRVGSSSIGVGRLADVEYIDETGKPRSARSASNIHISDSSFESMQMSNHEALSLAGPDGLQSAFGGMGLRPFGMSNTLSSVTSLAPASMLYDKDTMEAKVEATATEQMPIDDIDLVQAAIDNDTEQNGGNARYTEKEKAFGLYKGNDVLEPALATITAIEHLKTIASATNQFGAPANPAFISGGFTLNGLGHSVDVGVLAWRKSMMEALDAKTACHVGLKGGYEGDIFQDGLEDGGKDNYNYAEIYPWIVSKDESVNIDKDVVLEQPNARVDRRLTQPYLAASLPAPDSAWRFELVSADTVRLLKEDGTPATYGDAANLLGYGDTSSEAAIEYTIARNVDGQNHTGKGCFGYRLDEVEYASIQNVSFKELVMDSIKPVKTLGSEEAQLALGINDDAELDSDITKVRAVSINSCEYVDVEGIKVEGIESPDRAVGVEVRGFSESVTLKDVDLCDIDASETSVGLRVSKDSSSIKIDGVKGDKITAKDEAGISQEGKCSTVKIESEKVEVT